MQLGRLQTRSGEQKRNGIRIQSWMQRRDPEVWACLCKLVVWRRFSVQTVKASHFSDPGSPSESDEESDEEADEGSDGEGWPGEGGDGGDPLRVQRLYGGGGDGPWLRDLSRASPRRGARGEPSRRKRKAERTAVRAAKRAALGGVHPADERAADERGAREAAASGGEERGCEAAAGRGREAAGEERGCEAAAVRGREAAPAVRDREVVAATTPHHEAAAGHGHEAAASEDAARLARFLELATDCRLCGTPFLTEYLGAFPLCPGCRRVARRASVAPPRPPPKEAAETTKAAAPNVAAKAAGARRASVRATGSAGSSALSAGLEGA